MNLKRKEAPVEDSFFEKTFQSEEVTKEELPIQKEINKGRPKRQPVSQRRILFAKHRPGYVRRWVNDVDGRIELFKEGGWTIVEENMETADKSKMAESKLGSPVSRHVGGGTKAFLMEIPEEWYKEDQEVKHRFIDEKEKDIITRRTEGQYGKIEVTRSK